MGLGECVHVRARVRVFVLQVRARVLVKFCPLTIFKLYIIQQLLILQPFRCFIYVTAHSPTLPSLYLRHSL